MFVRVHDEQHSATSEKEKKKREFSNHAATGPTDPRTDKERTHRRGAQHTDRPLTRTRLQQKTQPTGLCGLRRSVVAEPGCVVVVPRARLGDRAMVGAIGVVVVVVGFHVATAGAAPPTQHPQVEAMVEALHVPARNAARAV